MLRKKQIALALSMAWGFAPSVSLAQQTPDLKIVNTQLEEITVSANRTERRVDKGANTVTLTSAAVIEQEGARDVKEGCLHRIGSQCTNISSLRLLGSSDR